MKHWNKIQTCINCEAVLLVERDDINIKVDKDFNLSYTFTCPCCNIENIIELKFLPKEVLLIFLRKARNSLVGVDNL